ncbi:MAG: pilus assembly protein [Planctomycetaceae bacterium]|nr:pilus assembly protein [Planctomycetaceae bacterium]
MRTQQFNKHRGCRRQSPAGAGRRGVAVIEAAVILPVMLVLVLGTIEMGTALRAGTILQSAVRESGRIANMDWTQILEDGDTPNAKLERDLRNFVSASGLPGDDLTVNIVYAEGDNEGQPFDIADENNELQLVKVEVTLPYTSISLFPTNYMAGTNVRAFLILRAGLGSGGLSS